MPDEAASALVAARERAELIAARERAELIAARERAELIAARERAVAVAYRMLGSRTDADDIAQETMLRVRAAMDGAPVRNAEAFATTVATRLSIDELRSARRRRETYVGPWLPEPVVTAAPTDPAELADSLSFALLVVLETLGPVERAAFLLHDVFGYGYPELGQMLERTEPACRQLVARARRRVAEGRPRQLVDRDEQSALTARFLAAARHGDLDGLLGLLAPDAVLVSDGGPNRKAARRPIVGRRRVAVFLRKIGPRTLGPGTIEAREINGEPGFVVRAPDGHVVLAGVVEIAGGVVQWVHWVVNPDKLGWVER